MIVHSPASSMWGKEKFVEIIFRQAADLVPKMDHHPVAQPA